MNVSKIEGGALTTRNDNRLPDGHRFGKPKGGQLSIELEGPTGFIEAHYAQERCALFFARSSTQWETITHLIRDTPDHWTHLGWSSDAEYRSGGRWVRMSEAPVAEEHHFVRTEHKRANLNGLWNLAGSSPRSGSSVASELCHAAIEWWDNHGALLLGEPMLPSPQDFCSAFPTLLARRHADDSKWNLIYATDSAEWELSKNGKWEFHRQLGHQERASLSNLKRFLSRPWKEYSRDLQKVSKTCSQIQNIRKMQAKGVLLSNGTEFPLILALLQTLLSRFPRKNWTFDDLFHYSEVNAIASYERLQEQDRFILYCQNNFVRWKYINKQWHMVPRRPKTKDEITISARQIVEAALQIDQTTDFDPLYSTDDLHSEDIWIISICGAKTMEDYPIMGVARGTPSFGGLAWDLSSDSVGTWRWNYIEEFDTNRLMPIDEGQEPEPKSTEPFLINQELGLLLEKFWLLATSGELGFEYYPGWLDFLEWVESYG